MSSKITIHKIAVHFKMNLICIGLSFFAFPAFAQLQTLGLEDCYRLAQSNYPLIKKQNLIDASRDYTIANVSKLYLPQLNISGQVSHQSETFSFPAALSSAPGIVLPEVSKDQYKIQGELSQLIFDGGQLRSQKEMAVANADMQKQQLAIDLYSLKNRINQIYFSILLMDGQLQQNELRKEDLQLAVDKMVAAVENGVAFRSNVDELKAELSAVESANIEFKGNIDAYLQMLSVFTGKIISDASQLAEPAELVSSSEIKRPELNLFTIKEKSYDIQERRLQSDYLPKFSAFFQGAYGRPTLNIIADKADFWYIGGMRLNWTFGSLYTLANNKKILNLDRQSLEVDRETFLFNTNLELTQQNAQAEKYRKLILEDEKAIMFRASVKESAKAQLDNGVITVRDFIAQLNAENLARQAQILHKIQFLQATYNLKYTSGN